MQMEGFSVHANMLVTPFLLASCGLDDPYPPSTPGPYDCGTRQYYEITNTSRIGPHMASHGFVVAGAAPLPGLQGMIDAEHAGALGYSFDGCIPLALSGVPVDPEFNLAKCAGADKDSSPA
jgi:hypothetical protein